jgi:hypothetical protein
MVSGNGDMESAKDEVGSLIAGADVEVTEAIAHNVPCLAV